jgi:hypothetical protein
MAYTALKLGWNPHQAELVIHQRRDHTISDPLAGLLLLSFSLAKRVEKSLDQA